MIQIIIYIDKYSYKDLNEFKLRKRGFRLFNLIIVYFANVLNILGTRYLTVTSRT